jgi:hypothetical protein
MSSEAKSSGGGGQPSKKSKVTPTNFFRARKEDVMESMKSKYKGKQILLKAQDIYAQGKVPPKEEKMLFQYSIASIKDNLQSAVIEYDDKCITNGGNQFISYPDTTGHENKINNYSLGTFQADHLLFNLHYGRSKKIKNDKEDAARKLAQEETVKSGTDLFDLKKRVQGGASAYALLVAEFQPCGDLRDHTIVKGLNQGKKVKKQKWSKINHLILFLISLLIVFLSPIYYTISHNA